MRGVGTMSSDEAAILRMICESPEDDLPRLILADWYQENGLEDRAEFMRLDILRCRTAERETDDGQPRRHRF